MPSAKSNKKDDMRKTIRETANFLKEWNRECFAQAAARLEDVFATAKARCDWRTGAVPVEIWKNGLRGFVGGSFTLDVSVDIEGGAQRLESVFYDSGKMILTLHDVERDTYRELFKGYWAALSNPDTAYDYASQMHFGGDGLPSKKAFHELAEVLSRRVDRIRGMLDNL